jgi:predicted small integral membrane protein
MNRARALKVTLVLVGCFFTAAIYPATMILWQKDQPSYETAMGLSVYATLGIMLLTAVRNPVAHRTLIAFAAWSSFAHASVMAVMVFRDVRSRGEWPAVLLFAIIGVVIAIMLPAKQAQRAPLPEALRNSA